MGDEIIHCCTMCNFIADNFNQFTNHVSRIHRNDPRFKVYCDFGDCGFSTKSWGGYKTHVSRAHREVVDVNGGFDDDLPDVEDNNEDGAQSDREDEDKMLFASYLLYLETGLKLSQKAVNVVVGNTQHVVGYHLARQRQQLKRKLEERNVDTGFIDDFFYDTGITTFSTEQKRGQFYKSNCHLVEPIEVVLGHRNVNAHGNVKRICDRGYIVPLKGLLQSLVRMPEVYRFISESHRSSSQVMFDICDGNYIKNDLEGAFQILLYVDDLEIVNPLGTHTRVHKITAFYVAFANIPPEDRSRLSSIYVIAIAKTEHLKRHGMKNILQDFISTVNELSSIGVELHIGDVKKVFKGALVALIADTPAANLMGGFKEGVGFANQPCRTCHVSRDELKQKLKVEQCQLRALPDHIMKCTLLFEQPLTKAARKEWSTRWGITRKSILLDINNFDVCNCLLHDPMHVLLEGVVPYEMALFIYYSVDLKAFFTLSWLNNQLATFPYSYLEMKDKPQKIIKNHYYSDLKIKQTSACTLTMCAVMPYILCKKVPHNDPKLKLLLLLMQITHLCTSPCATVDGTVTDLQYLISEHHASFLAEYPRANFTPKMHYMIHLPSQILNFGPGRVQWCMRWEAKHSQFTSIKWKNFKNLPKSLIVKHQKWMCSQMLSPTGLPSDNYLYEGDSVSGGGEKSIDQLYPQHRNVFLGRFPGIETVHQADSIVIHGSTFKAGCVLTLGYDEENFPIFSWVSEIYVHEHEKYFMCRKINIIDLVAVVNSYEIEITGEVTFVSYQDLFVKMPLSIHFFQNRACVCNKYAYQAHRM
ncbi:uncharacterized protein [Apostichopus japonicus]|uniref:uncharacterized protein n=1 Tax=Stichopus japonicus TaxID=307972 RepID=UPI003AB26CA5